MHICVTDKRLEPLAKWCPTLGVCSELRRADSLGPAGPCRGLVCEHGCHRQHAHVIVAMMPEVYGIHHKPAAQSAAREATALPYIGFRRAIDSVLEGTASTSLPPWHCVNEPGRLGYCLCCQPPPDPPFSVIRRIDP